jgi:hypothetical protein
MLCSLGQLPLWFYSEQSELAEAATPPPCPQSLRTWFLVLARLVPCAMQIALVPHWPLNPHGGVRARRAFQSIPRCLGLGESSPVLAR